MKNLFKTTDYVSNCLWLIENYKKSIQNCILIKNASLLVNILAHYNSMCVILKKWVLYELNSWSQLKKKYFSKAAIIMRS